MTPVSDSDLSNVTGQAGVSVNADLTMNIGIGTMAWGDDDGISAFWAADQNPGYVGVANFNISNLRIKARETDHYGSGYGTLGTIYGTQSPYGTAFLKPITIDVATGPKANGHGANTTYVRFGLGSLQITLNAMSFSVNLWDARPDVGVRQEMGTANLGNIGIFINPISYVDIYSHGGSGVTMDLSIVVDQFNMSYISWGDTDGLPAGNTGLGGTGVVWMAAGGANNTVGYIGLSSLSIGGPITITGTVAIDVATSLLGAYASGTSHLYPGAPTQVTVCHISFPSLFNLRVFGPITAMVQLDQVAALGSANAQTLGDIYISGFNLDIAGGSWVDIWGH